MVPYVGCNLLTDEQCGFRTNKSCVDQLYTLASRVRNTLSENKSNYACFIDMQKGFD